MLVAMKADRSVSGKSTDVAAEPPAQRAWHRRLAAGGIQAPPSLPSLPPTRAARPARSRGAFFRIASRWRGHWLGNVVCVVVATFAIVASAHFAQPAFERAALSGNAGPELLASAMRAPTFVIKPAQECSQRGGHPC